MPRAKTYGELLRLGRLPDDDDLLTARQCAAKVGEYTAKAGHRWWYAYARRHLSLCEGFRPLRTDGPETDGAMRWLRSAVVFHIRHELMLGPDVEIESDEADRVMNRARRARRQAVSA